jgi:L-fuconate dehydratase
MSVRIVRAVTYDVRFPTSQTGAGSDALNAPDYSAAYVALMTDREDELAGHGLTFTIGRGTEVCVAAIEALVPHVVGATLEELVADLGGLWRRLVGDTQLRWLGPEKGVIHLATAAIVNAVWDLYAKVEGKPLWKLLADLSPEQVVACIDFRYIDDVLAPAEALTILRRNEATKADREALLLGEGFPAYTTSAGWLGYAEETLVERAHTALEAGFTHLKLKVGGDPDSDLRRAQLVRDAIGPEHRLSLDANQAWSVEQAIEAIHRLSQLDPWWIEEPTSPDDILGHRRIRQAVAPVRVATGEHVQNRVVFKQLLQLDAIDVCQLDCCRLGGINEVLAVLLLAAKFGVPVCPHAGGVGLCEYAQHASMFDFVAVGASLEDRVCEFVDHLHEHFVNPVQVECGRYIAPAIPGCSVEIRPESLSEFAFPEGASWWKISGERAEGYPGEAGGST